MAEFTAAVTVQQRSGDKGGSRNPCPVTLRSEGNRVETPDWRNCSQGAGKLASTSVHIRSEGAQTSAPLRGPLFKELESLQDQWQLLKILMSN